MMLILQNISYQHSNKDLLFENLNLAVNQHDKLALIGNNGAGKSTLLRMIAGELQAMGGQLKAVVEPYYVPQVFGQYNHLSIAQALRIDKKITALNEILEGNATEENFNVLNDDWTIEERCREALNHWDIGRDEKSFALTKTTMGTLSGGQKTKVFLAGIAIHQPELVLLDEPTNHLDTAGRELLYRFVNETSCTLVVVSHDRILLNQLDTICELSRHEIKTYGGNYNFYVEQKKMEQNALNQDIQNKEKAFRQAKEKARETQERQQKISERGKKQQKKEGTGKAMMDKMKNDAEKTSSKLKSIHTEKISGISQELQNLRAALPDIDKMKFGFDNSALHKGKILVSANAINFAYRVEMLWRENLNFQITSGERIALKGANGSGKTTLIKLILGDLQPTVGNIYRADNKSVYIDQDYSLIDNRLNIYEQAQIFNEQALQEHEIKSRLKRFLFTKNDWDKPCSALSGGERMRLMLCCLTIGSQSPDLIILDEPTNNLDIQNIEMLTAAINEYEGTLVVVSHDERFLEEVGIERTILTTI
ncbi:MAG: ATP-binding cassette domain-containing protein [Prevotellaceae bacterium]|nr:ATP-binding cassette domain-containing protein [Prevotellaceae bacterium]